MRGIVVDFSLKKKPAFEEYAQQLKYNLPIEKQISIATDSQNSQQKWPKILHAQ